MSRQINYFLSVVILLSLFACKTQEKAKRRDLKVNKTEYLFDRIATNKLDFNNFSAKANVKLTQGDKKNFKANIRVQKDSLIWISISAFSIEVARVLITKDTVKVLNRIERKYFIGDYEYINKRFNVQLEFDVLQSILVGNPINFEPDEKVKFATDKDKYYLGNLKKRRAKKADNKPQRIEKKKEEVISLWIDQANFKIVKFLYSDLTANRFILGKYSNFLSIEDQLIPHDLSFEFQSEKPANVELTYSKIALNTPLKFSFKISSKYEQVFY